MPKRSGLFAALEQESPLQIVGAVNAYAALQAKQAGFNCLYLSGAGVANASFALPDLGLTSASDVAEDIRRITAAVDLPLLVDADTGWGDVLNVAHTVRGFERAGAAAMHIEDQLMEKKRCGHRPDKSLVTELEMCEKISAAVAARASKDFGIMARTDAVAVEGLDAAICRAKAYAAAGADFIFAEALAGTEEIKAFTSQLDIPVLINMTEFGKTPLMSKDEVHACGASMILYPLSAFRAMAQAAKSVYQEIRTHGSQQGAINQMQSRSDLYETLDYMKFEQQQDNKKD